VQAFRRGACATSTLRVQLRGLEPAARYRFTDVDAPGAARELTGREVMTSGLNLIIQTKPGALILTYEKIP